MSESKFTYLVTDPCYLINRKDWENLCDLAEREVKEQGRSWADTFTRMAQQHLRVVSGDLNAVAGNTGYGDWDNVMHYADSRGSIKIQDSYFVADAGCVCVVEVTPSLLEYIERDIESLKGFGGVSIIESDVQLHGEIDESDSSWSVVSIYDEHDRLVAQSENSQTEEN